MRTVRLILAAFIFMFGAVNVWFWHSALSQGTNMIAPADEQEFRANYPQFAVVVKLVAPNLSPEGDQDAVKDPAAAGRRIALVCNVGRLLGVVLSATGIALFCIWWRSCRKGSEQTSPRGLAKLPPPPPMPSRLCLAPAQVKAALAFETHDDG